jgi:hypothetical protein
MPTYATNTGNDFWDMDMKYLKSTGGENKEGQNQKSNF